MNSMRVIGTGRLLFALGLAGVGILSILSGDFAYSWQPVPAWVPDRASLAQASGVLLLVCGIGMLTKHTAARFALVMTIYLGSWALLLQAPRVLHAPRDLGTWLGLAESLVLTCGGWIVFASLGRSDRGKTVVRFLFGASCLVLGLSHFVYANATAGMVPAWLPDRIGFAYLTGAGHFAAGLGILFAIVPRLAATLEAIMISLFVLLLHIPGVATAPASRMQWTMMFVASALAGAAWAVAGSLRTQPEAKTIRIYRDPDCAKCERFASVHRFFDWDGRLDLSTTSPATGPLRLGEVVVEDIATGAILRGAAGIELVCREVRCGLMHHFFARCSSDCLLSGVTWTEKWPDATTIRVWCEPDRVSYKTGESSSALRTASRGFRLLLWQLGRRDLRSRHDRLVHRHDSWLSRIDPELLQDGHQRLSEPVERRLRCPDFEHHQFVWRTKRRMVRTSSRVARPGLFQ